MPNQGSCCHLRAALHRTTLRADYLISQSCDLRPSVLQRNAAGEQHQPPSRDTFEGDSQPAIAALESPPWPHSGFLLLAAAEDFPRPVVMGCMCFILGRFQLPGLLPARLAVAN